MKMKKAQVMIIILLSVMLCDAMQDVWQFQAQSGPVRAFHDIATLDDSIYLFGGRQAAAFDSTLNDIWEYAIQTKTWTKLEVAGDNRPSPRFQHRMVAYKNESLRSIFVFGGTVPLFHNGTIYDVVDTNELWMFDLDSKVWQQIESKSVPKCSSASMVVHDHSLYIYGGAYAVSLSEMADHNEFWTYDIRSGVWEYISTDVNPGPRYTHEVAILDDPDGGKAVMALFGGHQVRDGGDVSYVRDDLWLFSFQQRTWVEQRHSTGYRRSFQSMVGYGTRIWLFGGFYQPDPFQDAVAFLDVITMEAFGENNTIEQVYIDSEDVGVLRARATVQYSTVPVLCV